MAEDAGYSYVDRLAQLEEELYAKGIYVKEGSHPYRMSKFKQPSQQVIDLSRNNMRFIETVRFLKKEYIDYINVESFKFAYFYIYLNK